MIHLFIIMFLRHQREMEDSINNLGIVTSDKDVNDLAARHCEDAQVSNKTVGLGCLESLSFIYFFLLWINFFVSIYFLDAGDILVQ